MFRAPTEHEFEHEISITAGQQRHFSKTSSKDDDCDDVDDMNELDGEDDEGEDLGDLSYEAPQETIQ